MSGEPATNAREGLASVTVGTLLMLLGTLGFVGQNFVARVILARSLTPVEWGQFSIGLTLAGLLSAVGALGLPSAIARSLPFSRTDAERRSIIHSSFLVTLASSIVISLGLFAFGVYVGDAYGSGTLSLTIELFAVAVGFTILSTWIASIFQGFEDVLPNALFVQVVNPALFIAFLVLVLRERPAGSTLYLGALLAYVAAAVATLVALAVYAKRRLGRRLPDGPRAPRAVGGALPIRRAPLPGHRARLPDGEHGHAHHRGLPPAVGRLLHRGPLPRPARPGRGRGAVVHLPARRGAVHPGRRPRGGADDLRHRHEVDDADLGLRLPRLLLPAGKLPELRLRLRVPDDDAAPADPGPGRLREHAGRPGGSAQISYGQTRLLLMNNAISGVLDVILSLALIPGMGLTGAAIAWASATAVNAVLSMVELAIVSGLHPGRAHYLVPLVATTVPIGVALWLVPIAFPFWALPLLVVGIALAFFFVVLVTGSIDGGDRLVLEVVERMVGRKIGILRRFGAWGLRRRWGSVP